MEGKKSMKAFYATFILWYRLVRIHFLFQELSIGVSYKTFEIHWCKLNHSIRDGNCCKRCPQSSSTMTYLTQLLNLFLLNYCDLLRSLHRPDTHQALTLQVCLWPNSLHTQVLMVTQILEVVQQRCRWVKILCCLVGQMSCKKLWWFGSYFCVALRCVCRQGSQR